LSTDLGQLQRIAKSRLKLPDNIEMRVVPQSELEIPGLGPQYAAASWDPNTSQYLIKFVLGRHIEDHDFFHEFCHLKLIQIGFNKVESTIQQRAELCKSEQEQEGMNNAVIFIAEAYANYLLFRHFKEESELNREHLDCSFLFTVPLRRIIQKLGYSAIAQAVAYRIAKKWCGYNDDVALRAAFEEAFRRNDILQIYARLYSIMSELPPIREGKEEIRNMTPEDVGSVVKCALKLFKNEKEYSG
jgi:hypothetical protein